MAPDIDAGRSPGHRSDPFAPLTTAMLPVGDGHEVYVESVGRADGIPAVYLHGGPGSGCQPDHRRLFDPERFHAVLFDQRGAGRSRPKGGREANTLPHLIADMEMIREKFSFPRWMVVGGSWGATLALAYAQAHPDRVSGIVLRATFLGTRAELEGAFLDALPRFHPDLGQDFLNVLPTEERAQPLDAYWRRILDPDPAVHGPAARAWQGTESILSEHAPGRTRLDPASPNATRALPATPFDGSALFPERLLHEAEPASGGSRQAQQHSRHHRAGPLRPALPAGHLACACRAVARVRDSFRRRRRPFAVRSRRPGRGDESDRGSCVEGQPIGILKMPLAGKGMLLTSMDIDPSAEAEFNRWYDREHLLERVAIDGFIEARRYLAHAATPKYLSLYSTDTFEVLDSPAYRTALANQTAWSKQNIARFRNMIRAVARITVSRGQGRGAALGIVRLRPAAMGAKTLRAELRDRLDPGSR